jgi:hypothetical protein
MDKTTIGFLLVLAILTVVAIGVTAGDLPSKVECDDADFEYTSERFYNQSDRATVCNVRHLLGRIEKLERSTP